MFANALSRRFEPAPVLGADFLQHGFDLMRLTLAALLLPVLLATPVLAQDDNGPIGDQVGTYLGSGEGELTAEITHIENDNYAISISTVVAMENDMPGCGGGIDGEVFLSKKGGNFFVENEEYDPDAEPNPITGERYCEIRLSFEDGFLNIEERDGCLSHHGASCGFTGQLVNENAIN